MQSPPQPTSRPEKLARLASWVIAIVFAGMLNYLGSLAIRDVFYLPGDGPPSMEQYRDNAIDLGLKQQSDALEVERKTAQSQQALMETGKQRAEQSYDESKQAFDNWIATRGATADKSHDAEVVTRTKALDELLKQVGNWQNKVNAAQDKVAAVERKMEPINQAQQKAEGEAMQRFQQAEQAYELKVFGIRLAVILPLLLVAVWLFVRHRRQRYWPFVYGFGLFALFAFFVELAPYLPNFGGYIRAVVGIVLTGLAGVYLIRWLQGYLERKREEQARNQDERAGNIAYDRAMVAYRKHLCPGCEREYRMAGEQVNFCAHCGLTLFAPCRSCNHRNFAFFPYCSECGAAATRSNTSSPRT